jgi:hypothetical protein
LGCLAARSERRVTTSPNGVDASGVESDNVRTCTKAASIDTEKTRKQLARAGATHGACKVERALWSDGAAKAKFLLTCAGGALELSEMIDVNTRQITRASLAAPRTMANRAP